MLWNIIVKRNIWKERITDYFKVSLSINMLNWRVIFLIFYKSINWNSLHKHIFIYLPAHWSKIPRLKNHRIIKLSVILGERVRLEGIHTFWSVNKLMKDTLIHWKCLFFFLFYFIFYPMPQVSILSLETLKSIN